LRSVSSNITYTNNIENSKKCNIYIVTVPTPIDEHNQPNLSPLIKASKSIGTVLNEGDIVIYESTVYPGVTEEICAPVLEKSSNMIFNKNFFCGYSPERINPGDKTYTVANIVKVTSGSTKAAAKKIDELYKEVVSAGTYLTTSIRVAEASKVIENIQRDVNIALINELAIIFNKLGIDTNEVIEAAATKWNFIKLKPGLVGGHCISVDPYYLSFKAQEHGYHPDLILAARQINNGMSKYIADQTIKAMINSKKNIKNSSVLVLGITFKKDCPDMRNTKVIDMIEELKTFGVLVDVYDPWVDNDNKNSFYEHGIITDPFKNDKKYDAIIVAVDHTHFERYTDLNYRSLSNNESVIIDVKGIVKNPTWRL
jgi:UDP-N-acetyl-D-galactosamine dehydrogenase